MLDVRFESVPACRGHRWIFNLATCYARLNGRVRPKAVRRDDIGRYQEDNEKIILYCLVALFAALFSSLVPRDVEVVIPGAEECHAGCTLVAAGWPLVNLVDSRATSPRGSVSLLGGFIGTDDIQKSDFLLTFLFWLTILLGVRNRMKRWLSRA